MDQIGGKQRGVGGASRPVHAIPQGGAGQTKFAAGGGATNASFKHVPQITLPHFFANVLARVN